jgi:hypothetical protein
MKRDHMYNSILTTQTAAPHHKTYMVAEVMLHVSTSAQNGDEGRLDGPHCQSGCWGGTYPAPSGNGIQIPNCSVHIMLSKYDKFKFS